ncbi:MAG: 1,3-beta-galactosyl-N-acetylhexosamine phosphorylase, partial [Lachnospiraceae bacterium]|nr:1,3-beta-galactosyl-N-acetylhexosamine phosphorylase [Lachnospiraceae bacterium]
PYSPQNCRILLRAIYYAAHREDEMKKFYVTNVDTELAVFEQTRKIAVINNSREPRATDLYVQGERFAHLDLAPMEMRWIDMN